MRSRERAEFRLKLNNAMETLADRQRRRERIRREYMDRHRRSPALRRRVAA
jgi:hypothetical protein